MNCSIFRLESNQRKLTYEQFQKLIHPDERELWSKSIEEAIASGKVDDFEVQLCVLMVLSNIFVSKDK
jgi:hypothetical protein